LINFSIKNDKTERIKFAIKNGFYSPFPFWSSVLGFTFPLNFLPVTGLLKHLDACRKELKPFLANLGTRMRANYCALAAMRKKGLEEKD
jgi:hypothetical protein